jgi:hypothetical protein
MTASVADDPVPAGARAVLRGAVDALAQRVHERRDPWHRDDVDQLLTCLDGAVEPVRAELAAVAAAEPGGTVAQVLHWLRRVRLLLAEHDIPGATSAVIVARTIAFRLATDADLGPDTEDPHRWR